MARTGKIILTVALAGTMLGPAVVDFNDSHVFNPAWPPHARYHAVELLAVGMAMSVIGLWLVWGRSPRLGVATAVPLVVWGAFFVPLFVPGTSVEEYPGEAGRLLGIPMNLVGATAFILLALIGYWLASRSEAVPPPRT